jgi:hypothetical protein
MVHVCLKWQVRQREYYIPSFLCLIVSEYLGCEEYSAVAAAHRYIMTRLSLKVVYL